MKTIDPRTISDNMIDIISNEWMLITSGQSDHFNTMTASWGSVGYLWNKPIAIVFIRPERYTYGFVEESHRFTLSFLGPEHRDVHKITGSKSGRNTDKIAESGLHPFVTENGGILYEETRLGLECQVLYADSFETSHFIDPTFADQMYGSQQGGLHKMFISEITHAWIKE